jgi:uncharacterized delta-60 repeat protein
MRALRFVTLAIALVAFAPAAGCGRGPAGAIAPASFAPQRATTTDGTRGAGALDLSFGNHGRVVTSLGSVPVAALTMPDARIVVLADPDSGGSAQVIRLLRNGKIDAGFGSGGVVTLHMYAAYAVTAAPGGKLLVGGIAPDEQHAELIRLQPNGSLDATFGGNGTVQFEYLAGTSNGVFVMLLQPDGEIVAGGFAASTASDVELTALARVDSSGNPDPSFGTDGVVAVKLVGGVTAMALQSNGDILVCGGPFDPSSSLLARFLPNGTQDHNDKGGTLTNAAHTGSLTFAGSNEFDQQGRLLQWSAQSKAHKEEAVVTRLLRNQSRDPHFQSKPFAFRAPVGNVPRDVAIAIDGRVLVAGEASRHSGVRLFGVARLLAGGTLDPSFGEGGRVVTPFGSGAEATAIALAPDGKIILAGVATGGGSAASLAVARYLAK